MTVILKFGETYYLYALGAGAVLFYVYIFVFSMNWIGNHRGTTYVST